MRVLKTEVLRGCIALASLLAVSCGSANREAAEPDDADASGSVNEEDGGTSGGSAGGDAGSQGGGGSRDAGGGGAAGGASDAGGGSNDSGATRDAGGGASGDAGTVGGTEDAGAGGGDAGGGMGIAETCQGTTTLPAGKPTLTAGRWVDITPPNIPKGKPDNLIAQGLTMDPCNSAVLYWGSTPFDEEPYSGLYRSTNGGGTWTRLGNRKIEPEQDRTAYLDMPLRIRVDPKNPRHLYAGDGVRGATLGFWISTDAGETWTKPASLIALADQKQYFLDDIYDVAVDPTDFKHVLVSSHSGWTDTASGVLESKDGGNTWVAHEPRNSWGSGHSIAFLYNPTLGIGNANTWLLGTQADGYWRTTDGGKNWTQVSDCAIFHGGGSSFYAKDKTLYASCEGGILRSTNNGQSFTLVDIGGFGTTGVIGDGSKLYTAPAYGYGASPYYTSSETDGQKWTEMGTQTFSDGGPYEMVLDPVNKIIYSSNWYQGVWALKL